MKKKEAKATKKRGKRASRGPVIHSVEMKKGD